MEQGGWIMMKENYIQTNVEGYHVCQKYSAVFIYKEDALIVRCNRHKPIKTCIGLRIYARKMIRDHVRRMSNMDIRN